MSNLEASRRQLRNLLSRREFVAAAGAGALSLSGCGSGTPTGTTPTPQGSIPGGFQAVTGTVALPAGSKLDISTMSLDVLTQTVPVSAASGFTVGIAPDGPALAMLLDASGEGVLMALFDAGSSNYAVTTRTTAVALLFGAVGAWALPVEAQSRAAALFAADPAVAALDSAIATAVAADPHALANNAATIIPAMKQVLHTMLGASLRSEPKREAVATPVPAVPTLLLLNPTGEQNGVMVNQDDATASLLITNNKRRPCLVYLYEVTSLTGTVTTDLIPPVRIAGPIRLEATEQLNIFNAIKDFTTFYHGTSPFAPVNMPPLPLDLLPGTADRTTYTVVVLAASPKWAAQGTTAFEPPVYRDPHFVNEVTEWREETGNLFFETIVGDFVIPGVCFFGGWGAVIKSRSVVAQTVRSIKGAGTANFKWIIDNLHLGSLGEMEESLAKVVQMAVNSTTSKAIGKPEVQAVISQARSVALNGQATATANSKVLSRMKMFQAAFDPLFAAGLILDLYDFREVVRDFFDSELAASWSALLIRQKLNLKPQNPRIAPGERVNFNISLPANTTGTFLYEWSQTSLFSKLSAVGEANVGSSITTTKLNVDLVTLGSDSLPISVTVIGYDTSKSPRVEIGRSGTTVTFLQPAEILPSNPVVLRGDQRTLSVVVSGPALPNNVTYKWTLTGAAGTIGSSNVVVTAQPQISYIASGVVGTDLLHVDVLDGAGGLLAKAETNITVAAPASIQFDVSGAWNPDPFLIQEPPNGHYAYTTFQSARGPFPEEGFDVLFLNYDIVASGAAGVFLSIVLPSGRSITAGQTFTTVIRGQPAVPGQFRLVLDPDQAHPTNIIYGPDATFGTLKFETLGQQIDGTFISNFSFTVGNDDGGRIIGTGVARWKDDGTRVNS